MAHQTEIVVNGVVTEVTEFDHTAQEIDDGIDKVNTLTGEDIPTSASDSTSISSQLSNLESALKTPPQEFSLPLAVGIDAYGKSTYWKTQDGICFVNIAAHSSSASIIDSSIIATLPEGFRPDMDTYVAGHGFTHSGTRIALDVQVSPDGTIQIWAASALEYCSCFVGFVAAS